MEEQIEKIVETTTDVMPIVQTTSVQLPKVLTITGRTKPHKQLIGKAWTQRS
ncbi:hypothetical protein HMPREF0660_00405 [Prevotella melaninogenica D18]|jgi:hypothetical protein|nr:hypothetical protein HMPREF0660_00405 [Prevotella melaninogenica D18]